MKIARKNAMIFIVYIIYSTYLHTFLITLNAYDLWMSFAAFV